MKKILSLVFLLACTFTMMQAQDAVAKKACSKSSKACAKSCAAKKAKSAATTADVNVTRVAAAYMVADEAAAADESIEKIPLGIMAFEEAFDKILIENNNRREGLLFGVDDTTNWLHMEKQNELNLPRETRGNRVFPSSISFRANNPRPCVACLTCRPFFV